MVYSLLLGLIIGLLSTYYALLLESLSLSELLNLPALLIVFGGSLGATIIETSAYTLKSLPKHISQMLIGHSSHIPHLLIKQLVDCSVIARSHGMLSLEEQISKVTHPTLKYSLRLIVDGQSRKSIQSFLEEDAQTFARKHNGFFKFFSSLGGYCPTFGIIGAVFGLIHVLKKLNDPTSLGAGIAVAFIATIYGVFFSNMFFIPLAGLSRNLTEEKMIQKKIIMHGILSIMDGLNPKLIEEKLNVLAVGFEKQKYIDSQ